MADTDELIVVRVSFFVNVWVIYLWFRKKLWFTLRLKFNVITFEEIKESSVSTSRVIERINDNTNHNKKIEWSSTDI